MRVLLALFAALALVSCGRGSPSEYVVSAHGVRLRTPTGWHRVEAASLEAVSDPATLLVVGTSEVRPKGSGCQIAAYRVQPDGAVVVVVGWKHLALSGAQRQRAGRWPLAQLTSVHRPRFECFSGRGAVAGLKLADRAYQVNVMVGDGASMKRVSEALAVARSFAVAR